MIILTHFVQSHNLLETSFLQAPPDHLLAASVMSVPAALAFAKLLYPDRKESSIKAEDAYKVETG